MGSASSKPSGRKLAQTVSSAVRPGGPSSAEAGAAAARARSGAPASPPAAGSAPPSRSSNAEAFQASQSGEGPGPRVGGYGRHSASETKTKEILEDAGDPTLLQNLQRLGPVTVDHPQTALDGRKQHQNRMLDILAARRSDVEHEEGVMNASAFPSGPSDAAAGASSTLRLSASTIASLLDERKDCRSQEDLERLALEYDVPVELVEVLGRYVNTPSISESMGRRERLARFQSDDDLDGPPLVYAVWTEPKMEVSRKQIAS